MRDDVVVVAEHDESATSHPHTDVAHIAQVVLVESLDPAHAAVDPGQGIDDLGRAVIGPVVDDDQLVAEVDRFREDGLQLGCDGSRAVVHRQDHRDVWGNHRFAITQ